MRKQKKRKKPFDFGVEDGDWIEEVKVIKGKALKPGDTIGLIAPGSGADWHQIEMGARILEDEGFKIVFGDAIKEKHGYLGGADSARARDVNLMFSNPLIDGIICVRGGDGTGRLLDLIDYEIVRRNPKVFVGYSDITLLHAALSQKSGLVTFHGPMAAADLSVWKDAYSLERLLKAITNCDPLGVMKNPEGEKLVTITDGIAEGRLVGGNLALIQSLMGTPYELDMQGKILFIEDIDEEIYRIDRMLNQLKLSGKLQSCAGIIVGEFLNYDSGTRDSLTFDEVITDHIASLGIPAVRGLKCGHGPQKMTIPIGVQAVLDAGTPELRVTESAVM